MEISQEILQLDMEADMSADTADTVPDAEITTSAVDTSELEQLRNEVRELNERLESQQRESERISAQLGAFTDAFPDVDLKSIPDGVWDSVREGNSLAASYALYVHKMRQTQERQSEQNQKNAYRSAGRIGKNAANEYFTPDEVRKMSSGEVRANYTKIIESMKKWN